MCGDPFRLIITILDIKGSSPTIACLPTVCPLLDHITHRYFHLSFFISGLYPLQLFTSIYFLDKCIKYLQVIFPSR